MRTLALPLMIGLFSASAYADSSCTPLHDAFITLVKKPDFTITVVDVRHPEQETIFLQARPDGIYGINEDNPRSPIFRKIDTREAFSKSFGNMAKYMLSNMFHCEADGEEMVNDRVLTIYNILKDSRTEHPGRDRAWIGKDDGQFYRTKDGDSIYTITYGAQK